MKRNSGRLTPSPKARDRTLRFHRRLGLALALPLLLAALYAAALLWSEPLDRLVHPQRHAITGTRLLALDTYAASLRPGERLVRLDLPANQGPVVVTTDRGALRLDPPTARILDTAPPSSFALSAAWRRAALATVGLALLLLSLTGLWLWRPTVGGWRRGLRWRRRPEPSANLHHLLGLLAALPLAFLGAAAARLSLQTPPHEPPPARPLARTGLSAQQAATRALAVAPGPIRSLTWPTERTPDWRVRLPGSTVAVADDSPMPVAVAEPSADLAPPDPLARALLTAAALATAALAVTGVAMRRRSG